MPYWKFHWTSLLLQQDKLLDARTHPLNVCVLLIDLLDSGGVCTGWMKVLCVRARARVCMFWMWCRSSSALANIILTSVSHMNCMAQDGEGEASHWCHHFRISSVPLKNVLHLQNFLCSELWEFYLNILYCTKETQTVDLILFFFLNKMKTNFSIWWSFEDCNFLTI